MEPIQPAAHDADPCAPQPVSPEDLERLRGMSFGSLPADMMQMSAALGAVAPAATIFGKAFLEALAKRSAEGVAALPGKLRQRWFRQGHDGSDGGLAAVLDIENVGAAAILVTADLPDEARVALIDLDPTEPGLLGKVLGWDVERRQWVAVEPPTTQVDRPTR
ncbi:hypothetical protein [Nocardia terpenica]|uniref:Uncharacterized protein n=1 Tax=Nocardia terpenica TaxID=455432 RepID=A0A6G9Z9N2_9NOCA|nr:hypothetical protein [Nocardia terpenica]QIS22120.1 hypothetical protein F6W96_31015 [Nocardia terpenica]